MTELVDGDPEVLDLMAVETGPHRSVRGHESNRPQVLSEGRDGQPHVLTHDLRVFLDHCAHSVLPLVAAFPAE